MAWDIGAFENVGAVAGTADFVGGSSVSALGAQITPSNAGYIGSNPILKKYIGANLVLGINPPTVYEGIASFTGGSLYSANQSDLPITGDILPITQNRTGFTRFELSTGTVVTYVSSSTGNDINDGSIESPVETLTEAYSRLRNGEPDWICLKSGDEWEEGFPQWKLSGKSLSEPIVITSYGVGSERPLILNNTLLYTLGGGGSPTSMDYLVLYGVALYNEQADPDSTNYTGASSKYGISFTMGSVGFHVEDCYFDSYKSNMSFSVGSSYPFTNLTIRRNILVDAYAPIGEHGVGIYLSSADSDVVIEENILDHNGWHESVAHTDNDRMLSHGLYLQFNNYGGLEVKNNIITNSSSHAVQQRNGGIQTGNLIAYNPIGLLFGGSVDNDPDGASGIQSDNVVLEGINITTSLTRGWGLVMENINSDGLLQEDNVITNVVTTSTAAQAIYNYDGSSYITANNNRVWDWDSDDTGKSYVDPSRDIESYSTSVGGAGTFADFIAKCRSQGMRAGWDTDYDVSSINPYFVAGVQDA